MADDLTDRPAPVVAHRDVVNALAPGAPATETAPGITTRNNPTPSAGSGSPGPTAATPPAPEPDQSEAAPAGDPTPAPPGATPTTQPSSPATTQPPSRPTATFSTAGGVVTVACNGSFFIDLVSATPRNGYAVNVATPGPYYVEVHFIRAGQDDPIWAFCLGQPIRANGAPRPGQTPGPP